jgi:predicted enzyme related to lactoylglutathione lyase
MKMKQPEFANGKICYLEIPTEDVNKSSAFYREVFGWRTRKGNDGSISFDDSVGQVSGTWVPGRKASADPGIIIHIMVADALETMKLIEKNNGKIIELIDERASEVTSKFQDPFGNIFSIYQQPGLKA